MYSCSYKHPRLNQTAKSMMILLLNTHVCNGIVTCVLGIALGFIVLVLTTRPILFKASFNNDHIVDLPDPLGPTMTTPIRCLSCSCNSRALDIYKRIKKIIVLYSTAVILLSLV